MIKPLVFFLAISVSIALVSCTEKKDYNNSPNGLQYKLIVDNGQPKAKTGEVIEYNIYWRTIKDSLFLSTSERNTPLFSKVDQPKFKGDPLEILTLLGTGDSASCLVPADSIFRKYPPAFIHHGDLMKLDFKVLNVMSEADYTKQTNARQSQHLSEEQSAIDDYITKNNLKGEKTTSGLYVVIEEQGKGSQPENGSTVKVNYTGMLLNGTKFESSLDPGHQPYEFQIGTNSVIKGWDEGIPYFKAGGKGKLIMPSSLAYGDQGNGRIPPNSPLVFEIQLMEVK